MILGAVPKTEWLQVQNKCATMDALDGRRKDWGCVRNWVGNYLVKVCMQIFSLFSDFIKAFPQSRILFIAFPQFRIL